MISSEVQRTLVKSPPELWAEISDPESLARHLGEFGEIRITRVEPEQRVDWQAGDTSGSVVIKPSGWGTKVKLTVTRELAEPPAVPADGVELLPAPDPGIGPERKPQPEPPTELEPIPELEPAAELEPAPEFETETEPELAEPQELANDDDFADELEEDEDELAEEGELEPEVEAEAEADDAAAERLSDGFAEEQPAAYEPRRGFFARLFGRRRRTPATDPQTFDVAAPGELGDDPSTAEDDASSAAQAPQPYNALAVWASQIDSGGDVVDDDSIAHEYAAEAFTQPEPEPAPTGSEASAPVAQAATGTEDDADADGANEAARDSEGGASDISAEIRAAEEVAAEEVTAVLSGVLDRLGAAHHRPFSRA
jgi:septum site-determining protein MinD